MHRYWHLALKEKGHFFEVNELDALLLDKCQCRELSCLTAIKIKFGVLEWILFDGLGRWWCGKGGVVKM